MFELPRDDIPPEHLWHHAERMEEWWAAVEQRRKDRFSGVESVPDATDDEHTVVNELAAGLRA